MKSQNFSEYERQQGQSLDKKEFIKRLAHKTGLSVREARIALNTCLGLIVSTNQNKEAVHFSGFGTFEVRYQKSRQRRNPRTGRYHFSPARYVPKFRAGECFLESLS